MDTDRNIEDARFWAISGLGYGRGFTPGEAIENYVATQLRNMPAKNTIFETKPKWEKALRTGEAKARVWHAPEGVTGFVTDGRLHWLMPGPDGKDVYVDPHLDQLLDDTVDRNAGDPTWTFVGHWEDDRIVVEYVVPGEVMDPREDTGFWEQGLFASSASGATQEEALAKVRAEYEAQYQDVEG